VVALIIVTVLYIQATTAPAAPAVPTQLDIYGSNDWWSPRRERRAERRERRREWRELHD
jgi:hypothetical protein